MKFILTENPETKTLTFKDVEINQFFVNNLGYLCQKRTSTSFTVLTDELGRPYCDSFMSVLENTPIKKLLPKVRKIEF